MSYHTYERWKKTLNDQAPCLSIVIPTYNEEVRIIPTIGAFASCMADLQLDWELIISDDGSTDETLHLVDDLGFKNIRILRAPKNEGKGSAVRRGMLNARGKYILFADADNSTPVEELEKFLHEVIQDDFDIAIGTRAGQGAQEAEKNILRQMLSNSLRWLVRTFFHLKISDTQCGFKMYKREVARRLFAAQTLNGFSFDLEILYLATKLHYRIVEIPVQWVDAPFSKVSPFHVSRSFLRDLLTIKFNTLRGVYTHLMKMRVAIVSTYPPGMGSLNEYAYHFVRFLQQKTTVDEILLLTDELPDHQTYPDQSLTYGQQPLTRILPCWRFDALSNVFRILTTLFKEKPDVILFNVHFATFGTRKAAAFLGLMAPVLAQRFGFPTMVLLHNLIDTIDLEQAGVKKIWRPFVHFFGTICTRLLLTSGLVAVTLPSYAEYLERTYGARNVVLIPHGAFEELPPPTVEGYIAEPTILTFGKFGTYKRLEALIEAFELLQAQRTGPLKLVIAGNDHPSTPGYLASMQAEYAHIPGIRFTGYVPEEEVATLFQQATLVVFPYVSTTGSSGVLHQAGQYGKAVILPNIGDLADVIQAEGYTGKFFEPADVHGLAQAIAFLLDNPEDREAIGQQNYIAASGLPIDDIVDWYLFHFQNLTESVSHSEKRSLQWTSQMSR